MINELLTLCELKLAYQINMNFLQLNKLLLFLAFLTISSCNNDNKSEPKEELMDTVAVRKQNDSIDYAKKLKEFEFSDTIKYTRIKISSTKQLNELLPSDTGEVDKEAEPLPKAQVIMTLNRKERRFIRVGDSIIVPEKNTGKTLDYSVFPRVYWEAANVPKIIILSNALQAYACYEKGKLVRYSPVNSGKEATQTYPGKYYLNWKQKLRTSSLNEEWELPYTFNFHKQAGNAFHQYDMPGRPVSHSCVRQMMHDAKWLFKWGRGSKYDSLRKEIPNTGTPVLIIDHFNYSRKRFGPWVELKSNKDGLLTLPKNPLGFEEPYIPLSQIPDESKGLMSRNPHIKFGEDTLRARGIIREGFEIAKSINFNKERKKKQKREAHLKSLQNKSKSETDK